ncbi:hypothetical protein [Liquorilactobacillus nagelii]|uniref:hypothetical protein n=1 Tax=Liquorilactobacillus nagelii TaxID=82688 RepID=UPI0039E85154
MNKDEYIAEVEKSMRKIYNYSEPVVVNHLNDYVLDKRSKSALKDLLIDKYFNGKAAIFGKGLPEKKQKNFQYVFVSIYEDNEYAYIAVVGKSSFWNKKLENGVVDSRESNCLGDLFKPYTKKSKTVECVLKNTKCNTLDDINAKIITAVILPIDVHNYQTKRLKGKHKTKPDLKAENYENKIRDDLLSKIKGKGLILNIK